MEKIIIAICSYRRADLLKECLISLARMRRPDADVRIVVVDNDKDESARATVEGSNENGLPAEYYVEPNQGLPYARNKALDVALLAGADYLVFIDDDEQVHQDWLVTLFQYSQTLGGECVVSGAVVAVLPDGAPDYVEKIYRAKSRASGTELSSCATNNVLIPVRAVRVSGVRFDVTNPYSGGEDTLFFQALAKAGVRIVKCAEAVVYETIPQIRTTLAWLLRRKFWVGTVAARRKLDDGDAKLGLVMSSLFQVLWYGVISVFLVVGLQRFRYYKSLMKVAKNMGLLAGLFGVVSNAYGASTLKKA